MRFSPSVTPLLALGSMLLLFTAASADTTQARCDIYPRGEDRASASLACRFSQRQGYITIDRADGVLYELRPSAGGPGNFTDQDGGRVYRQSGLGKIGVIFRMPTESVYVYWDASTLASAAADPDSPTAPYTTADYDAAAVLDCSFGQASYAQDCPAGILRGDAGFASIRIMKPDGSERVLNFEDTNVTTPDEGELSWQRIGDEWRVSIDDQEYYVVPEAAIYGD